MANQQGFSASGGVKDLEKILAHLDRTKLYDKDGNLRYQRYPNLTQRGVSKSFTTSAIDPTRTHLNYNLAPAREGGQAAFIERRLAEVYVHKSALKNTLVDWVVTLPAMAQYEGREHEFFKLCYAWLAGRYGEQNVVSAYVHMDEVQPHIHFAFLPIVPDGKHGQGFKLSKKAVNTVQKIDPETLEPVFKNGKPVMNTASFSLVLHLGLNEYIQKQMGVAEGGIRLTDEQRDRREIRENMRGPAELREATQKLRQTRAELAQIEAQRVSEVGKLQGLQGGIKKMRSSSGVLSEQISEKRAEKAEIEQEIDAFSKKRDAVKAELTALEKLRDAAAEWLAAPPKNAVDAKLRYLLAELAERFGGETARAVVLTAREKYDARVSVGAASVEVPDQGVYDRGRRLRPEQTPAPRRSRVR